MKPVNIETISLPKSWYRLCFISNLIPIWLWFNGAAPWSHKSSSMRNEEFSKVIPAKYLQNTSKGIIVFLLKNFDFNDCSWILQFCYSEQYILVWYIWPSLQGKNQIVFATIKLSWTKINFYSFISLDYSWK